MAAWLMLILTGCAGPTPPPLTRVETDQITGAIRFIVDGREEARIDATGLHVRQGVVYWGSLADVGVSGYDMPAKPEPKP